MDISDFLQGDSLVRSWQLGSGTVKSLTPIDLTGCVAGFGMVPAQPSGTTLQCATTDESPAITITNATQGMVALNIPPALTETLTPGLYFAVLKIQFADGSAQSVYSENIRVLKQVSNV